MSIMKLLYTFALLWISANLFGQTTGPLQPEVQGFIPVNSNDLVDLYSGDLKYSIPLLTIPGPEGMSYPINIFYSSNVSMETMPSIVGLGWNLNVGAIVRDLRGLPDDFSGDEVKQTSYTKPSWTISFNMPKVANKKEVANLDFKKGISAKPSLSMYYNNYSGLGATAKLNVQAVFTEDEKSESGEALTATLGFKFDNQEGFSLSPSMSYDWRRKQEGDVYDKGTRHTLRLGAAFNSQKGFKEIDYGIQKRNVYELNKLGQGINLFWRALGGTGALRQSAENSFGSSHSFAFSAPISRIKQERFSTTFNFGLTIDGKKYNFLKDDKKYEITGSYMRSWVRGDAKVARAFGAMYMDDWQDEKYNPNIITDFYRENDDQMHKKKMLTPIPVMSYDMFTVQGHGIGGTFRVHQGSIGRLSDAELKTRTISAEISAEIGFGSAFKLGGDFGGSYGESYSGPWKKPSKYLGHHQFNFEGKSASDPLFEPAYFKMIGEPTFMPDTEWELYEKDTPIAFDISASWTKTKAYRSFNRLDNTYFNKRRNENRVKRVTHIEYFTKGEINQLYGTPPIHITDHVGVEKSIDYTQGESHHIHGYTVRKADGVQYNYFLPAYNTETVRETFTIPGAKEWHYGSKTFRLQDQDQEKVKVIDSITYEYGSGAFTRTSDVSTFAKVNNGAGDEFYSKEEIPGYAHTYFLTSILSPDYVDVDHNGPSENDLGTYIKFNYFEVKDYKWRFPFSGYYYARGYMNDKEDDKASVQWGTKDLYYVNSIETKTHIAVFHYDTMSLLDANNQLENKKITHIELFSKAAGGLSSIPIQTVYFEQDYELKEETINSVAVNKGVLTLKGLKFTYQDNDKGELTPYRFEYENNINYAAHEQDVWGAYQPDEIVPNRYNSENPFTYQYDYVQRDINAAPWLLHKITLPSKGEIHIDYEKDDYAYVQDKKAMAYLTIEGTGDSPTNINRPGDLKNDDLYIFFKSPVKLNIDADVKPFVDKIKDVKFRAYSRLKKMDLSLTSYASDYVEGYAKVESYGRHSDYIGWVKLSEETRKLNKYHPFRLAAFQYIRKSRPDLGPDYNDASNLHPLVFAARYLPDMVSEYYSLFDYYRTATVKNYAPSLDNDKPSFIRLNIPFRKYGGGARVKEVTLVSNDVNEVRAGNPIYGQEYNYVLSDGATSSGVAEFEPLVGISENPFTQPIFYGKKDQIIFADGGYLPEEPMGAGLFPSARVGYSRVSVRNKSYITATDTVSLAQSGINISEFYTAKDFPTRTDRRGALYAPMKIPAVPIPFIGSITVQHSGYSMGYQFEKFEGIYGSLKSVATYPYSPDEPTAPPIQQSVYSYKRKSNDQKALDDRVTVLQSEGLKEDVYLNKNIDFYIDEIEASSFHASLGAQPNLNYMPPATFLPGLFPSFSYLEKSTRYLTTNKVIYTYPVLDKIEQFKDGAKVTTSTLAYDGETGESIITAVTNEWGNPVYTYYFPAHWTYEQMKGAYKNYKARISVRYNSANSKYELHPGSGLVGGQIPTDLLQEGDFLISHSTGLFYYVSDLDRAANTFDLKARDNASPVFPSSPQIFTVMTSGYRNLQSLKKGHIVSLVDYSNYQGFNTSLNWNYLMYWYNQSVSSAIDNSTNPASISGEMKTRQECVDIEFKSEYTVRTYQVGNVLDTINDVHLKLNWNNGCILDFPLGTSNDTDGKPYTNLDLKDFRFNPTLSNSDTLVMDYIGRLSGTGIIRSRFYAYASPECVFNCDTVPIPVLQASAIEYKDDFKLNYKQLEDESTDIPGSNLTQIRDNGSGNPYAYGMKGIWRPWRTSSYLEKRKQTQSASYGEELRLDLDGEFDFYWFDWKMPINYNEGHNWRWVNEVTQYNPNGLSQEGKNRLDIFSASLFGNNNHLVTASASNSKTTDIAFDGFEDYDPSSSSFTGLGHGNLNLTKYEFYEEGHTGNRSLNIGSCNGLSPVPTPNYCSSTYLLNPDFFQPKLNTRYYISGWTKYLGGQGTPRSEMVVRINGVSQSFRVDRAFGPIDGWYKIDGYFDILTSLNNFSITLGTGSSDGYAVLFDDIRIQPFHSVMETYVYDPENYRLKATLNNQNFATFYVYDEEGSLVGTKVETEEGIKTISTNRNNIHQD